MKLHEICEYNSCSKWNIDFGILNENWFNFIYINWLKILCRLFYFGGHVLFRRSSSSIFGPNVHLIIDLDGF